MAITLKSKGKSNSTIKSGTNTRPYYILGENSSFAVSEAYKNVRTNLQFVSNEDGCNIIAITSSVPTEGKTISCINIAVCLAQSEKKVLIIDADMRKPQIASTLGLNQSNGLSELLTGLVKMNRDDVLATCQKTSIENLDAITSGKIPPNPAELLGGKRLPAIIEILAKEYDYIMIDTTPVLVVTDALVIRPHIHGYIVVARAGESKLNALKETIRRLNQVEANICGFLLNGKKEKSGSKYGRYGKYGKYAKYGYGK